MPLPLTRLSLHSEPYAPTGNIGDGGFRKLLGAPSLDLMQTVVREAVQNCCDADKDGNGPVIHIRLRALNAEQKAFVAGNAFAELPNDPAARQAFETFLCAAAPLVLEICDFNTTGLGGPTRADTAASEDEPTDFIDFLRNVGTSRDTVLGGGTYGFGKVSLYVASRCSTILVDTQTDGRTGFERRLMGCHLGAAEGRRQSDGSLKRYTGRHWWGVLAEDGRFAEPLRGDPAREFSERIGFPRRADTDTGTSIMIVDPHIGDDGPELAISRIAETLLWNFWPRMMATTPKSKRLQIRVFLNGEEIPLPRPEDFPPLDLFCQAMNRLREGREGTEVISSQRPAKDLGRLCIAKGLRARRTPLVAEESLFPSRSCHIAVMRPVELVVRYYEGDPLPDERTEWAGVFVTSTEAEVERAFAEAEPPAHDDWQPDMMAKGPARTYVRVAIKEIRRRAKEVGAAASAEMNAAGSGESLAAVAQRLGSLLDSGLGHGASRSRSSVKKTSRKSSRRVSLPEFVRLELVGDEIIAVFHAEVTGTGGPATLKAEPLLAIEGGAVGTSETEEEQAPAIVSIELPASGLATDASTLAIGDAVGRVEIRMTVPDERAVSLSLELTGEVPA